MNDKDKKAVGIIIAVVALIVVLQLGMSLGRMALAEDLARVPGQPDIDRLRQQLAATQYDLEIEREKLNIILCESNVKHHGVWGDGGKSYGIAQFQYVTFNELRKEAGRPDLHWKDRDDQLWLLDWALRHGYGKYWSCFGQGGTS